MHDMVTKLSVKKLRNDLKLNRVAFAEKAGVDVSTISRWETKGVPSKGPARAILEHIAKEAAEVAA